MGSYYFRNSARDFRMNSSAICSYLPMALALQTMLMEIHRMSRKIDHVKS